MKKVLTSNITSTVSMSFKSGVLDHMQNAHKEVLIDLAYALVGSDYTLGVPFAITGCINMGSGSTYNITKGLILYSGELYVMPAASFTHSGGQTAIVTLTTSYNTAPNADPVYHTDGNSYNVLEDKTMVASGGTSGTGTFDYSEIKFTNLSTNITPTANYTTVTQPAFRKDFNGRIYSTGVLQCGASAAEGQTMFTYPVNNRPTTAVDFYVTVYSPNVGGTFGVVAITINTDGTVVLNDYVSVSGTSLTGNRISLYNFPVFYSR